MLKKKTNVEPVESDSTGASSLVLLSEYLPLWLQVFTNYEKLLHSENYVTKRQSLKVSHAS